MDIKRKNDLFTTKALRALRVLVVLLPVFVGGTPKVKNQTI